MRDFELDDDCDLFGIKEWEMEQWYYVSHAGIRVHLKKKDDLWVLYCYRADKPFKGDIEYKHLRHLFKEYHRMGIYQYDWRDTVLGLLVAPVERYLNVTLPKRNGRFDVGKRLWKRTSDEM